MYTPHDITLYDVWLDDDDEMHTNITILRGVMLQNSKADNVRKSGLTTADSATLYIPFSVDARGSDNASKSFLRPKEYKYSEDKETHWTLFSEGELSEHDCFFVKGVNVVTGNYKTLRERYDDVYRVSSVDYRDFGSEVMRHWQVGAK